MEAERARERRVRLVIKSGGVVVARSCRLYAVKDDPTQEEKKSEELPSKRLRLNVQGSATSQSTAADRTSVADKTDVKMTRESQSSPADKFSVQIPQNPSFGEKFEVTKRKLHQSYQESNNARKQRSVKVLEVDELPKPQDIDEEKLRDQKKRALMKKRIHMPSFRLRW